jgi:hypothetical protein
VTGSHQSGNGAQPSTHLPFFFLHTPGFRPAAFMIIPAEMQHTMDQQRHELFFQRSASRLGLTLSRRQADDDLTEVGGSSMEAVRRSCFSEREGQDVRTAIFVSKPAVEPPHPPIAHEREVHIRRRLADELEDGSCQSQDPPATDCHRPNMDLKRNGH